MNNTSQNQSNTDGQKARIYRTYCFRPKGDVKNTFRSDIEVAIHDILLSIKKINEPQQKQQ